MLDAWAQQWGVPKEAVDDLKKRLGAADSAQALSGESEAAIQSRFRAKFAESGGRVWRNNVGAVQTEDGRFIRYGLCNDSTKLNAAIKSSDLIGIKPVTIQRGHVGCVIGQFFAREVKRSSWKYRGTPREQAQLQFLLLVTRLGGDAKFINSCT